MGRWRRLDSQPKPPRSRPREPWDRETRDRQTGIRMGADSRCRVGARGGDAALASADTGAWTPGLRCQPRQCRASPGWAGPRGTGVGGHVGLNQEGRGLDGCLGGLPASTATSSPRTEGCVKKARPLGLCAHTRCGWLSSPGIGTHRAPGAEEDTCLHFHRLDVGLLLFFACEEGRTKGLSAE